MKQKWRACALQFQTKRPVVESFGKTSSHKIKLITTALNIKLYAAEMDKFRDLFFILSSTSY
jgi:hypothetical protein